MDGKKKDSTRKVWELPVACWTRVTSLIELYLHLFSPAQCTIFSPDGCIEKSNYVSQSRENSDYVSVGVLSRGDTRLCSLSHWFATKFVSIASLADCFGAENGQPVDVRTAPGSAYYCSSESREQLRASGGDHGSKSKWGFWRLVMAAVQPMRALKSLDTVSRLFRKAWKRSEVVSRWSWGGGDFDYVIYRRLPVVFIA